jgi:low temperature requirement protein LtrA
MAEDRQASWLELFFDLVLVAAVGALAAQLHEDHSLEGLLVFAALFVPVWWAWWGFTWYSAAFNDDDAVNRVALLAAMGGVATLAAGVAGVADGRSDTFVVAYAALFALLAALYARAWLRVPAARSLSSRYAAGYLAGATLWLASLAFGEGLRPVVWVAAMVVLMASPVLAAASLDVLSYEPRHIAERYGLFTLIVLGESVVAIVAGLDTGSSTAAVVIASLGLAIAGAVWWLYFDRWRGMPVGTMRSGFVWAQGHLFVFAGIAAAAVGVEFAIEAAAAGEELELADRLPLGGGLAAYLVAMAAIRAATRRLDPIVGLRLAAAATMLMLSLLGGLSPLWFALLVALVVAGECALDLIVSPPEPGRAKPTLPHAIGRRRQPAEGERATP